MKVKNIHFQTIDSTNTWAKANTDKFNSDELTVIIADEQTAGRGRFQKPWISPKGENVYATFYFTLSKNTMHIQSLAQLMTFSLAMTLLNEDVPVNIKWPNDILINGKKVAGILCEVSSKGDIIECFIGVGINVDVDLKLLEHVDQLATSLNAETHRIWQKEDILTKLQQQFIKDLEGFRESGFTPFLSKFENLMIYIGKTIVCKTDSKEIIGICHSLTNEGQLNLCLPNGELVSLSSAEVSVQVKE